MLEITAMQFADYEEAMDLWQRTPELGVSREFDSPRRIQAYLERNPGFSTVARVDGRLVGTVLCGHDGRRGSIYHVTVLPEFRGQKIAEAMLERCYRYLKEAGIGTAFLFVHAVNTSGIAFWTRMGWTLAPQVGYYYRSM